LGGLSNAVSGISFLTALSAHDYAGLESGLPTPAGMGKGALNAWDSGGGSTDMAGYRGSVSSFELEPSESTAGQRKLVVADPRDTDLDHFHSKAHIKACISRGSLVKIRGLSDCCRNDGKVELHRWLRAAMCAEAEDPDEEHDVVVVKRILRSRVYANCGCESNERLTRQCRGNRDSEDCLTEIGVYSQLFAQRDMPEYILRMRESFTNDNHVWLVLEYCEGGDLFGVMQQTGQGRGVPAKRLVRWMWQLLQAVSYLHKHLVGHRDISMENILLRGEDLRLMDFGQAVRTHSSAGLPLRYFVAAGKPYYRGSELYNPAEALLQVVVPPRSQPGQVVFAASVSGEYLCEVRLPLGGIHAGSAAAAEPWGYAAAPADIFACGVCLFILATGLPPWKQARPSDPHFAYANEQGVSQLLMAWDKQLPPDEQELLVSMLRWDPAQRPTATDCLNSPWLAPLRTESVPVHPGALSLARESSGPALHAEPCEKILDAAQQAPQGRPGDTYAMDAMINNDAALSEEIPSTPFAADFYSKPPPCRAAVGDGLDTELPTVLAPGDFYSSTFGGVFGNSVEHVGGKLVREPTEPPQPPPAPIAEVPWKLGLARVGAGASISSGLEGDTEASKVRDSASAAIERFSEEATPPSASSDSEFRFEPTTLHVCGSTPARVGNHLLDFLTAIAGASVLKVNRRKFTVKAAFEGNAGTCILKVRIYTEGPSRYAVEFQRRGGEAAALHLLYRRAMEYLGHLVRALAPSDSKACALEPGEGGELRLSSLDDWADPGVRGLLKRNRQRQRPHTAPADTTAATKGRTAITAIANRDGAEPGTNCNPQPVPADCKV
jgi:serine/threonine protein kinase